jgi:hypothetical protein
VGHPFLATPTLTHRFNTAGTKSVRLQVRDHLALVADAVETFDVAFAPDPGTAGPEHPAFDLPFQITDAVFDPARPYLYVSRKADRKVDVVNLLTGLIEREYSFSYMPESLAMAPDGSRLYVALLAREHDHYWFGDHEGFVASIDLRTGYKDREFHITEDPFDLVVTRDGYLVVSSGSGQWSWIRVFNGATGEETSQMSQVYEGSRLALHPSQDSVYAVQSELFRYGMNPGGESARINSTTTGRIEWVGTYGLVRLGRSRDARWRFFTAPDMFYLSSMSAGPITELAWDPSRNVVLTLEGSTLHAYNLSTRLDIESQELGETGTFVGIRGDRVYVTIPTDATTKIIFLGHPVPDGASNTPPVARFTISPDIGPTTLTQVLFDASSSTDAEDQPSDLRFRWDLDNDGTWDTPFKAARTATWRYLTPGTKSVRLKFEIAWVCSPNSFNRST